MRLVEDDAAIRRQHALGRALPLHEVAALRRAIVRRGLDREVREDEVVVRDEDLRLRRGAPSAIEEAALVERTSRPQARVAIAAQLLPEIRRRLESELGLAAGL